MLGLGWLTLRQAKAALQNGRLEDAQRLLEQPSVQGHRKLWELLRTLADAYADRGRKHLDRDDAPAAWGDLLRAEAIAPESDVATRLRTALGRLGLAEVRGLLEAGEPGRALEAVGRLRDRVVNVPELQPLEDAARDWQLTQELADRGEFALAEQMFERVRRVSRGPNADRFRQDLDARQVRFQAALPFLHDANDRRCWRDVLKYAEEVLAAAPHHAEARKARGRAWQTSEPETLAGFFPVESTSQPHEKTVDLTRRLLLWIDGVGGYLICLGHQITLGQAGPDSPADIPLLADVSRIHASIVRDAEGYVIEAGRPVQVNGQLASKSPLQPGDRVTLGSACQFTFLQPVPVSASARLEMASGQRFALSVDAVLLMAETLVLGPGGQSHVLLPDAERPVVLVRQGDGLAVAYGGEFRVDGRKVRDREQLGMQAVVSGPDFAFALEPAGTCLGQASK